MSIAGTGQKWRRAAMRGLRLLTRPVRRAQGAGDLVLEPFRGYGSRAEIFLIGRVFRQSRADHDADRVSLRILLRDVRRRITRHAFADAPILARFGGSET